MFATSSTKQSWFWRRQISRLPTSIPTAAESIGRRRDHRERPAGAAHPLGFYARLPRDTRLASEDSSLTFGLERATERYLGAGESGGIRLPIGTSPRTIQRGRVRAM